MTHTERKNGKKENENNNRAEGVTLRDWLKVIYDWEPNTNSHHATLTAHIMLNRLNRMTMSTKSEAVKWLMRVQRGSHFAHADRETTKVILEYYARRNNTVRQILGVEK